MKKLLIKITKYLIIFFFGISFFIKKAFAVSIDFTNIGQTAYGPGIISKKDLIKNYVEIIVGFLSIFLIIFIIIELIIYLILKIKFNSLIKDPTKMNQQLRLTEKLSRLKKNIKILSIILAAEILIYTIYSFIYVNDLI